MHILDPQVLSSSMERKGISSLLELSSRLKIHRNTVYNYAAGAGVLPSAVEKILEILALKAKDIIVQKRSAEAHPAAPIATIVNQLKSKFPKLSFFLFGSRSRGDHHKYSDFDVGVYCVLGIPMDEFLKLVALKEDLIESAAVTIQLTNLSMADRSFLQEIAPDLTLLAGTFSDLLELQKLGATDEK